MSNPFEPINARLTNLEALTLEVLQYLRKGQSNTSHPDTDSFGDFKWLSSTCPGIPDSTLRQWDAAGKIPGSLKFGKRKLYDKQAVIDWLRSLGRQPVDSSAIEQTVNEQISRQLSKGEGIPA